MTMEDQRIIELFFARDEEAIRAVSDKYGGQCMHTAMNILDNRSDAEECVNDTWLKTWNAIPPQRPPVLVAFLCRITRNLAINRYHARKSRDMEVALHELEGCLAVDEGDGGALASLLDEFLAKQEELDRRLFVGRYWHAYPVKTLAKAYGMTANAVSLRLLRTREKLRAYLNERGYSV